MVYQDERGRIVCSPERSAPRTKQSTRSSRHETRYYDDESQYEAHRLPDLEETRPSTKKHNSRRMSSEIPSESLGGRHHDDDKRSKQRAERERGYRRHDSDPDRAANDSSTISGHGERQIVQYARDDFSQSGGSSSGTAKASRQVQRTADTRSHHRHLNQGLSEHPKEVARFTDELGTVTITKITVVQPVMPLTFENLKKERKETTGMVDPNITPRVVAPIDYEELAAQSGRRSKTASSRDTRGELQAMTEPIHHPYSEVVRYAEPSASCKPSHHRKRDDSSGVYLEAPAPAPTKHRKSRRPQDDPQALSQASHPRHTPDQPSRLARTTSPVPEFWQNAERARLSRSRDDPYFPPIAHGHDAFSPRYQGSASYEEAARAALQAKESSSAEPGYPNMSNRHLPASTVRQSVRGHPQSFESQAQSVPENGHWKGGCWIDRSRG